MVNLKRPSESSVILDLSIHYLTFENSLKNVVVYFSGIKLSGAREVYLVV